MAEGLRASAADAAKSLSRFDAPRASGPLARCPICAELAAAIARLDAWGYWCRCARCDLEFADPMKLPEPPEEMYTRAYRGEYEECGMGEFAYRLSIRPALIRDPRLGFFNPAAVDKILDWLRSRLAPGATVLELGCAAGFLLHTLRREGFNPVGLDVALPAVELNRSEGFKVWHGTLDTMPRDFVDPAAIVSLFMIHHLDDPLAFFKRVAERWPLAPIAIAEYGHDRARPRAAAFPPRTLTRWSRNSLTQVLERAGYEARAIGVRSTGNEHTLIRPIRSAMRWTIRMPTVFRLSKRIQRRVLPVLLRPLQQDDFSVVGFGQPRLKA